MVTHKNNVLVLEKEVNASSDLVWKALTDFSLLKQWMPFFPEFKAQVGFVTRFNLGPDEGHQYRHIVKVLEVIPNKKLTYTWYYDGYAGRSHVTFDLLEKGENTKIVLTHTITEEFPADPAFSKENFSEGWTYTINGLKEFVEKEVKKMSEENKELTLTRFYDAPRDLVWKAWTDPELVAQWWGPNGFTNPVCEIEPKVGGKINIVMEDSAGLIKKGSRYPMTGTFTEIDEPKKMVYTSEAILNDKPMMKNLVTVSFDEENGKTKMTVHIVVTEATPEAEMPLRGMEMGWNQQLDKLNAFLQKA